MGFLLFWSPNLDGPPFSVFKVSESWKEIGKSLVNVEERWCYTFFQQTWVICPISPALAADVSWSVEIEEKVVWSVEEVVWPALKFNPFQTTSLASDKLKTRGDLFWPGLQSDTFWDNRKVWTQGWKWAILRKGKTFCPPTLKKASAVLGPWNVVVVQDLLLRQSCPESKFKFFPWLFDGFAHVEKIRLGDQL